MVASCVTVRVVCLQTMQLFVYVIDIEIGQSISGTLYDVIGNV